MPKVSIIIPVYNVEPYLRKALDSVVNQTLADIEIICINDCSPDNSLVILEEYAQRDSRIKIINQETNQGQGVARNLGIDMATGEYIGFVDPDDWIEPNMYETYYNLITAHNADLLESLYSIHKEYSRRKIVVTQMKKALEFPQDETFDWKIGNKFPFVSSLGVCVKLFKTSFIKENNIQFDTNRCAEDQIFSIKTRIMAKKIIFCEEYLYNYRIRMNSSTAIGLSKESCFARAKIISDIKDFLIKENIYNVLYEPFWNYAIPRLCNAYKRGGGYQKGIDDINKALIPNDYLEVYENKKRYYRSFKERLFSVKKMLLPEGKFKILTILGIKIPIKKYIR